MKITYVKLKNFVGFKSGLGVNEVELDLTNSNNRVILLTGENGCGKTTLLSSLHPFATNGSIDVRNDNSLILSGKDGYKEIRYLDDGDEFIIKHYYSPKSTGNHTVKSYIEKNGIELNSNGNITSFKELIKQELDMEQDYLKLMRLGSNVSGFIDAKSTERKSYIGKILDDIDLFLKYHKQTTATVRELKSIISHTSDKLNKLGISDKDKYYKEICDKELELDRLKSLLENYKNKLAIVNNELSKLNPSSDELELLKQKMKKVENRLKTNITLEECELRISELSKKHNDITTMINATEVNRNFQLDQLSTYYEEKNKIEAYISSIKTSEHIKDIEKEINEIQLNINSILEEHDDFVDDYKLYDRLLLEKLISMIMVCIELGDNIKNYNYESLILMKDLYEKSINIKSYINEAYKKIDEYHLSGNDQLNNMINELSSITLTCQNFDCPLYKFWNKYKKEKNDISIYNLNDRDFYEAMSIQYNSLSVIKKNIESMHDFIETLPINLKLNLNINMVLDNLIKLKDSINLTPFNNLLSEVTEYELYQSLTESLLDLEERLKLMKKDSNIEYYEKRLRELEINIEQIESSTDKISKNIKSLHDEDLILVREQSELNNLQDVLMHKEEYEEEISTIEKDLKLKFELNQQYSSLTRNKCITERQVEQLNSDITSYKFKLNEYESLTKDMNKISKKLDMCLLIQRSLSTKEGMPLKFIENYFNSANDLTNELLYSVYGEDLQIDKFIINTDSFTIPYTVNNVSVPDVIYSSQGEKSFISIALSFALATQNLSKYNIMLLDEVDSPLDTSNREKFINIIEAQCDMIDAEQIFLISHNNMFHMYPVDVINMKNHKDRNMELASYIDVKTK